MHFCGKLSQRPAVGDVSSYHRRAAVRFTPQRVQRAVPWQGRARRPSLRSGQLEFGGTQIRDDHIQDRGYERLRPKDPLWPRLLRVEPGELIEPRSEQIDAFFTEIENLRRLRIPSIEELLGIEAIQTYWEYFQKVTSAK